MRLCASTGVLVGAEEEMCKERLEGGAVCFPQAGESEELTAPRAAEGDGRECLASEAKFSCW